MDDMGKARMWREWESWGSRTRWHGRVVDRRWHLKSLEFKFVFNPFFHLVFVASGLVVLVQVALEGKGLVAALAFVVLE